MAKFHCLWFSSFFFLLFATFMSGKSNAAQEEERKTYIVYMGVIPDIDQNSLSAQHAGILQEVVDRSPAEQHLVRSYTRSFNAFAANLTEQEYQKLTEHEEVVSVFPSKTLQLLTTESWDFTGLPLNVNRNLTMEKDVIIGVLDTGIWPESKSFSDTGLGPVPKKWKGTCDGGKGFACNGKIIGARKYTYDDARDYIGHGSHTASTAAGNNVPNASFYGIAEGTARGGVPSARIAVYKVCSAGGCSDTDVLAAFDDAIADGVDILSVSLGAIKPIPIKEDAIAIGSFHAALKGILTVNAAGNTGFYPGTITSIAPWLFSVAASTTKRKIISKVSLKNGKEIEGRAVNAFRLNGTDYPLIYGLDLSVPDCDEERARMCAVTCIDPEKIKGKILICKQLLGILEANSSGVFAAISLSEEEETDVASIVPLPASLLDIGQFDEVVRYYNSTKNPRAYISQSVPVKHKIAPVVASFSSRGPNTLYPDILKPDITAPGVDILAAYSPKASPSYGDKRSVSYSFLAGTSMACPHVSGGVAYVKSFHPDWSPSALKSAVMTTAWRMNASQSESEDAEFAYGAGHFDPVKALDPGLVYETTKTDYVKLICSMKLDDKNSILKKMFGENITCTRNDWTSKATELNYPSMSAQVDLKLKHSFSVTFPRTVKNVGTANSTYKAITHGTPVCNITVNPSVLSFQALNEKKSFKVTVSGQTTSEKFISASLEWSDGVHSVRSPIVIY